MVARRAGEARSGTARALAVLGAFDHTHRALTLSDIARRADLPLATAHRIISELDAGRLLVRRPDGAYEIGARGWHLGLLAPQTALREAALPHLQDLVTTTGHTVHMAVLDGPGALVLERLAGSRTLPTRHTPGTRLPLHCTAVGKALLSHAPAGLREATLAGLTRHTAYTVTDRRLLERQLDQIRRTGVARSAQEHRLGVSSVAMPILDHTGLVAALGLLAPLTSARLGNALAPMRAAAAAITQTLSAPPVHRPPA
jgi:DNA-binding IclR family transcriptional regulator